MCRAHLLAMGVQGSFALPTQYSTVTSVLSSTLILHTVDQMCLGGSVDTLALERWSVAKEWGDRVVFHACDMKRVSLSLCSLIDLL